MPPQRKAFPRKTASHTIYTRSATSSVADNGNSPITPLLPFPGSSHSHSPFALTEPGPKRPTSLTVCPTPEALKDILSLIPRTPADGSSTDEGAGALVRRQRAIESLGTPISTCIEFSMWLDNQICVEEEALLHAIERDGSDFLRLASATIAFDSALRGKAPPIDGVGSTLVEHAETLSVFAELLKSKISEGSLSEELATAVLRDGASLLRLATSCLEFDRVLRGSDSAQVK